MYKTVCFSGPRPKKLLGNDGYNTSCYTEFIHQLTDICKNLYNNNYRTFITGGAQGIDQCVFWAVNNIKNCPDKTNELYIPFDRYGSKWKKTGLFSQTQLESIFAVADNIKILSDEPTDTHSVINALMDRNHAMIDSSNLLVAVYKNNHSFETDKGGTAEAIRYALHKAHKPVLLLIYDNTGISSETGSVSLKITDSKLIIP